MDNHQTEKNLELERMVFFSDAIVAIAITLLALDLRIQKASVHLTFADVGHAWQKFFAFFLSFIIIAIFWKIHHQFFYYIKMIDQRIMLYNLGWLLFIVVLPFVTTLVSADIFNTPAVFIYSTTIFLITFFQNAIWDYTANRPDYLKNNLTVKANRENRVACNLAMGNAILAMIVSFFSPLLAFIILFTRILMFRISAIRLIDKRKKAIQKKIETHNP